MHYISAALISELLKHSNNSLSDSAKIKRASLFESVITLAKINQDITRFPENFSRFLGEKSQEISG